MDLWFSEGDEAHRSAAKEQDNRTHRQKSIIMFYTYIVLYNLQDAPTYVDFLNHQKAPDTYISSKKYPHIFV